MVEVDFILIKATVSDHLPGFQRKADVTQCTMNPILGVVRHCLDCIVSNVTLGACIVGSQAAAFPPASPTCVPPPRSIARRNRFADNERRGV